MFGVFTFTLTHFLAKTIFPEGMGVYKIVVEIPEGWEVILLVKKWKFRGGEGGLHEIPSMVGGMDIFWNYTMGEPILCRNYKNGLGYMLNYMYIV